jgi:hypothetical protein
MRLRLPVITGALILAVVACNKPGPVANNVAAAAPPVAVNADARDPAGGPTGNKSEPAAAAPSQSALASLPAGLQGRWGLTPGDCTAPLANAKGLLVVNSGELRFYESRAVPAPDVQTDAGTTSGTFHFTGEGRAWDKFESLQRNGDKLTRTEGNPTASYTYAKC